MAKVQVNAGKIAVDLADLWKKTNQGYIPIPGHQCSNDTCNIIHINGWVSQNKGELVVSITKPASKQRRKIQQLYICKETGTPHWCHSQCGGRKPIHGAAAARFGWT